MTICVQCKNFRAEYRTCAASPLQTYPERVNYVSGITYAPSALFADCYEVNTHGECEKFEAVPPAPVVPAERPFSWRDVWRALSGKR
jgi:hypothetical protein